MAEVNLPGQEPEHEEKHGFSLFKKKEEEPSQQIQQPNILKDIGGMDTRLRVLEERYNDLDRRTQFADKNILEERKRNSKEVKLLNEDILEIKRNINSIMNKLDMIVNELKNTARKTDLDTLSKYIDFWEPVNFATKNEVEQMIKEKLEIKEGKSLQSSSKAETKKSKTVKNQKPKK